MTLSRTAAKGVLVWAALSLWQAAMSQVRGQNPDEPAVIKAKEARPGGTGATIQSINEEYNSQLLRLERARLEQLAELARTQQPKEAAQTYEVLFRLALANNLFREAEPVADQVLKSSSNSPAVSFLAHTLNIIAEADRGAYQESLDDLRKAVRQKPEGQEGSPARSPILDTPALLAICEAYYQRLLQGEQFDVARKAFRVIINDAENTAVKGYCSGRLNQLDMIGKSAQPSRERISTASPSVSPH